ncbi:hypothetical protein ABZ805_16080 [Saccharopolyspora sp. NPDC047091]|uniref:hypothetical protein n=1 Tax=Saccharopolyspora sp. NPDC047091 TaxID=3155924 RepID=UPI0033E4DF66
MTFQYHAAPSWTLRAILRLSAPGDQQSPIERPARECFLPEGLPQPVLIRPLSPSASI